MGKGKTIGEVFETLNKEQKTAVYAIIGMVIKDTNEAKAERVIANDWRKRGGINDGTEDICTK